MKRKILLILMPFWTPQIPPLGISCLKGFLQPHGFDVRTADANTDEELRRLYDRYFAALRESVPEERRGNFYNTAHEVLQNHMLAHLNRMESTALSEIVRVLVLRTFFTAVTGREADGLIRIVGKIYKRLEAYLLRLLDREKPEVLGLSVFRGNLPASLFGFRLAREKYPGVENVMGGAVFSQALGVGTKNFQLFLKKTAGFIDKIIIGEGEKLLLKLLQGELPPSQRVFTLVDIGSEVVNLSDGHTPDFSDFDLRFYPHLPAYSSRSCPFQCAFCSETGYWGGYRKKSPGRFADELQQLYRQHGSQLFLLCDSLLNPVIDDLAARFRDSSLSVYWDGYLRVDHHVCDSENALQWRRGGFYRARLGIESGSQKMLNLMDKKITVDQIRASISSLAAAGVKTTTYWIVGYPGETEEDFSQTLTLLEELKDDIYEAECNPFSYYPTGQVLSDQWASRYKYMPVYPEFNGDMMMFQTWQLDCRPTREETHQRIGRFVEHCRDLNIANPYTLHDIDRADDRWRRLHANAVPPLLEFKSRDMYISENKKVSRPVEADSSVTGDLEFGF